MALKEAGASLFFMTAGVIFGFVSGGFLGARVFGGGGMGWDQLADALGGMMLGVLFSFVLLLMLVRRLTLRQRFLWAAAFLAGSALLVAVSKSYPKRAQLMGPGTSMERTRWLLRPRSVELETVGPLFPNHGMKRSAGIRPNGRKVV
jgi:hypothetical protein